MEMFSSSQKTFFAKDCTKMDNKTSETFGKCKETCCELVGFGGFQGVLC